MTKEMFTHNRKDDAFLMSVSSRIKFIVTEGEDETRHFVFFVSKHQHNNVVREVLSNHSGSVLLGAGEITREGVRWGSVSCLDDKGIGFDRPKAPELADSLLQDVDIEFNSLKGELR